MSAISTKDAVIQFVREGWTLEKTRYGQSILTKKGHAAKVVHFQAAKEAILSDELDEKREPVDGMLF